MIHSYSHHIDHIELPELFTFPFCYQPHPLCKLAAEELQTYLKTHVNWENECQKGKMFGVLVVQDIKGKVGYLAAYSGALSHGNHDDYFVPPIYDLSVINGFFKIEEEEISAINRLIDEMENHPDLLSQIQQLNLLKKKSEEELLEAKRQMQVAKERRSIRRKATLSNEENDELNRESQYHKASYKRLQKSWNDCISQAKNRLDQLLAPIERRKEERKMRSAILQQKIFSQFRLLNARGEVRDLCDIFSQTETGIPPAGAGECAAPRLLQYAYLHDLKPIAMAEFWWGKSPKSEIRVQGYYYPSCKQKCAPILAHMLQGLKVEPNPLKQETAVNFIQILYEDESIVLLNKPFGMLSVPGKEPVLSVYDYISKWYPEATGPLLVHRLDMDTSGILLVAKNKEVHEKLQIQFESREVKKRYVALLDGLTSADCPSKGFIKLSLRPDYENRPYQLVDEVDGKPAVTRYEILGVEQKTTKDGTHTLTRVAYFPQTGRTHQLRVHSAHPLGMGRPIYGDRLYGRGADRLYLHAEKLEFRHPTTGKIMRIESPSPF